MLSKIIIIVLLYFTFVQSIFLEAQENKIVQVKGVITSYNNEVLPYVFIYDEFEKKGYLATEHGEFNIFTERGTSLIFSYIGRKKEKFTIPAVGKTDLLFLKLKMATDTLILPEVLVLQWKTYKQFIHAVVTTHVPDDDIYRTERNFDKIKRQAANPDYGEMLNSSMTAYRLAENQHAADLYWKGQTQPMQIFNLVAWEQFLKYLKEGKFKKPKKQTDDD